MAIRQTSADALSSTSRRVFFQRYGLVIVLVILCALVALGSDRFLTPDNLINILRQSTINGIIAVGMMIVIVTRGIDLSVGSVLALSTAVAGTILSGSTGATWVVAILIGVLAGSGLGAINGTLVAFLRVPPFIATLGMLTFARGLALTFTGGQPVSGFPEAFRFIGTGTLGPIPVPVVIAAGVFIGAAILLNYSVIGRYIFAVGDNERAAYLTGIPRRAILVGVYALSGALASLAGLILIARLNSTPTNIGEGFEFDAIAAVVVGGTNFSGGEGTLLGTLIGVLIIAVLSNALNLLNVPPFYQGVVKGVVIVAALLLNRALRASNA